MLRLCIFNSVNKTERTGRVLMSRVWDLLIHSFGTHLSNMRGNFQTGGNEICVQIVLLHIICSASHYVFKLEVFLFNLVEMVPTEELTDTKTPSPGGV